MIRLQLLGIAAVSSVVTAWALWWLRVLEPREEEDQTAESADEYVRALR